MTYYDCGLGRVLTQAEIDALPAGTDPPIEHWRAVWQEKLRVIFHRRLGAGYTYDFGGAIGEQTFAVSDTGITAHWLSVLAQVDRMVADGDGALTFTIRTADEVSVNPTATEVQAFLEAMLLWDKNMKNTKWVHHDAIDDAPDKTILGYIDLEFGWP